MAIGIVNTGGSAELKKLTLQLNGTTAATYDGSESKSVNVTPASIGLGSVDNTADKDKTVKKAGTAESVAWSGVTGKPSIVTAGLARYGYDRTKIIANGTAKDIPSSFAASVSITPSDFVRGYDFYASGSAAQFIEYRLSSLFSTLNPYFFRISFTLYKSYFALLRQYNFAGGLKVVLNAKTKDSPDETTYFTLAQFSTDGFGIGSIKEALLDVDLAWYVAFYGVVLDNLTSIRFVFTESDSEALITGLTFYFRRLL